MTFNTLGATETYKQLTNLELIHNAAGLYYSTCKFYPYVHNNVNFTFHIHLT